MYSRTSHEESGSLETLTEHHQPFSIEVFLDTTIHCSRFKGPLFTARIDRVLRLFGWWGSSSYTKVEFGNVVLAQAQYYLKLLERYKSLRATLDHIGNRLVPQFHQQQMTWSFNLLSGIYGNDDGECTERAVRKLRLLMKTGVRLVERDCHTPFEDGTHCYWASRGALKRRDGSFAWKTPNCRRHAKRCQIDRFFAENRELFINFKEVIDGLPETAQSAQLQGFSEVIGKAMKDPTILLDYATGCRRLADAIIAVESAKYRSFFTQNISESETLTSVLGQAMYFLPQDQERGTLVRMPPSRSSPA
jgi:hypothetical protein